MEDLVSVIIPTYNRSFAILERAINSVLKQSYQNFELIIVDDSPCDNPNRIDVQNGIIKIDDPRIIYIKHESNQGACKARNTGIKNSKGQYISFLDDDDEWLPPKIELQLQKFIGSQVGLVYCDSYTLIMKNGTCVNQKQRSNRISGWVFEKLIVNNFIGSTSFVMLKREVFEVCGIFDNDMKSAQDYELWLRIAKKYKVDYVDIPLVHYYEHEEDRISTNTDYKIQGLERLNEINSDYLNLNPKTHCLRKLKITPYYAIKYGKVIALKKWFEAAKLYPFYINNIKYLIKILIK